MIEFRDALTDLLEEFGTDDGGFKGDLPEGRYMRVDSKNFYFDIGQNNRGIYMRISEVRLPGFASHRIYMISSLVIGLSIPIFNNLILSCMWCTLSITFQSIDSVHERTQRDETTNGAKWKRIFTGENKLQDSHHRAGEVLGPFP